MRLNGSKPADIEKAAELLLGGGLVAFPTETVYGLGANGLDPQAVEAIFAAKGRPADNPVILHVADFAQATTLWSASSEQLEMAARFAHVFWPGPLTLVLPAADSIPGIVTAGLPSVAVRCPAHPVAQAILQRARLPLAAPSANRSGRPSPTLAAHVATTLGENIDAVVDGGATEVGIESTVLDLRAAPPRILRPGSISASRLRALVSEVRDYSPADLHADAASPGLRHRHYAPAIADVAACSERDLETLWHSETALLLRECVYRQCADSFGERQAATERLADVAADYARELYAALYRLEQKSVAQLRVVEVPEDAAWDAVRDRLRRATGSALPS